MTAGTVRPILPSQPGDGGSGECDLAVLPVGAALSLDDEAVAVEAELDLAMLAPGQERDARLAARPLLGRLANQE